MAKAFTMWSLIRRGSQSYGSHAIEGTYRQAVLEEVQVGIKFRKPMLKQSKYMERNFDGRFGKLY